LGFKRAGKIIDELEEAGIISGHSPGSNRDVLIKDEMSLEKYFK